MPSFLKKAIAAISQKWHLFWFSLLRLVKSKAALNHLLAIRFPGDGAYPEEHPEQSKRFDKDGRLLVYSFKPTLAILGVAVLLVAASLYLPWTLPYQIVKKVKYENKGFFTADSDTVIIDLSQVTSPEGSAGDGLARDLFQSDKTFMGDTLIHNDAITLRSFIQIDGDTAYYFFPSDDSTKGNWVEKWFAQKLQDLTNLSDSAKQQMQTFRLKTKGILSLRKEPRIDDNKISRIPKGTTLELLGQGKVISNDITLVELLEFGTNAQNHIWFNVRVKDTKNQTVSGWIAGYKIDSKKFYIEIAKP